jgi:hypothetical protein
MYCSLSGGAQRFMHSPFRITLNAAKVKARRIGFSLTSTKVLGVPVDESWKGKIIICSVYYQFANGAEAATALAGILNTCRAQPFSAHTLSSCVHPALIIALRAVINTGRICPCL